MGPCDSLQSYVVKITTGKKIGDARQALLDATAAASSTEIDVSWRWEIIYVLRQCVTWVSQLVRAGWCL